MSSSIKNYTEQGGERTIIGGELAFEEGARVNGLPSSASAVVLDMQEYNLGDAIFETQNITSIISAEQFYEATSGDRLVIINNATFGGLPGKFSLQGLEISQGQMIFGVAHIPQEGNIGAFISLQIWTRVVEADVVQVVLRVGINNEFNSNPGLTPFD